MYYIHKHEVQQCYGGSEEGGWWYNAGIPDWNWTPHFAYENEDTASAVCRELNDMEHNRREREEQYDYTSVLSYRSTFYEYSVEDTPNMEPFPQTRPHYE